MIYSIKQPIDGGFLVTIYHRQNDRPVFYNRLTMDEKRADTIISQVKKEVLQEKIFRFLNHRKNIMENHGGFATAAKYSAIDTIAANLHERKKSTLESNCKLILDSAEMLKSLIPGKTSIYHEKATQNLREILEFCSTELKTNL